MSSRRALSLTALTLGLLLSTGSPGEAKPQAVAVIPFPSPGNVTVARLVAVGGTSGGKRQPRVALGTKGLPSRAYVVAGVAPGGAARFAVTVAVFNPLDPAAPSTGTAVPKTVTVRLSTGFSIVGAPRTARDVLYANPTPSFARGAAGTASLLGGVNPPKLPPARIVEDAKLLAFDRSIPLVDVGVLGLQFVAAEFSRVTATTLQVKIGIYQLSQINAVELRFPAGTQISKVSGPPGTDAVLMGGTAQLISSRGFFQDGISYTFRLQLTRTLKPGSSVMLRASTHYFESALPFIERFVLD